MPKNKVLSPCLKSPATELDKDRCQWSDMAKTKGQASTSIQAVNWEAGAGAVKMLCSRKDWWGL